MKTILLALLFSSCTVIEPGNRAVKVTLGKIDDQIMKEGMYFYNPFLTNIEHISIKQRTQEVTEECFSSDLQELKVTVTVLYRIPEGQIVTLFKGYKENVFSALILPRLRESLKEVTILETAESIAKKREEIKTSTLEGVRKKVGELLIIDDVNITNIGLSQNLTTAIEAKMVEQQRAQQAQFKKERAMVDVETVIIKAKGEAEALEIQGKALTNNPRIVELELIRKWDGKSPQAVSVGTSGASIILPLSDK
jgi:regulator of protease activity HflC (stomatin/prohibitin superfamily)